MFVEMTVAGITMDPFSNSPIVILKDPDGTSALPIWIGILEASAIATELGEVKPPRPMTHDLMKSIFENIDAAITRIEVTDLKDNTFFATIHLSVAERTFAVDARPSDAIALALRMNSPIFVSEEVIEKSQTISLDKEAQGTAEGKDESKKWEEILENLSPEDFGKYKM